jgi:hypothetical protein
MEAREHALSEESATAERIHATSSTPGNSLNVQLHVLGQSPRVTCRSS